MSEKKRCCFCSKSRPYNWLDKGWVAVKISCKGYPRQNLHYACPACKKDVDISDHARYVMYGWSKCYEAKST